MDTHLDFVAKAGKAKGSVTLSQQAKARSTELVESDAKSKHIAMGAILYLKNDLH